MATEGRGGSLLTPHFNMKYDDLSGRAGAMFGKTSSSSSVGIREEAQ
jgi:hypothetical protein